MLILTSIIFFALHVTAFNGGTHSDIISEGNDSCTVWKGFNNLTNRSCECGDNLNGRVLCDNNENNSAVYLLYCYCMSWYPPDNNESKYLVGSCIYNCFYNKNIHLYLNDSRERKRMNQIGVFYEQPPNKNDLNLTCHHFNRTGPFCGDCMKNHSPTVFSYSLSCINCTDNIKTVSLKVFKWIIIPQTAFYIVVLMFRFSVTSPKFTAFLLVSQILGSTQLLKLAIYMIPLSEMDGISQVFSEALIQFYSMWNLDFFRFAFNSTCLPNIDTHTALQLELIPAVYPLLLAFLTLFFTELHARGYKLITVVWSPFHFVLTKFRKNWNIQNSIIDVFATFLYLSFVKLTATALDLMTVGVVRDINGNFIGLWSYYQASARSLRITGATFLIMIIFLFFFTIIPMVLILLYPIKSFRTRILPKMLCNSVRSVLAVKMFMDILQGYYKDGTEPNTRDHRYMAGLYLLLRLVLYLEFMITLYDNFIPLLVLTVTAFCFLILITKPYRPAYRIYNTFDAIMLGSLALLFLIFSGALGYRHERKLQKIYKASGMVVGSIPALYFVAVIVYNILSSEISAKYLNRLLQAWKSLRRRKDRQTAGEASSLMEKNSIQNHDSINHNRTI